MPRVHTLFCKCPRIATDSPIQHQPSTTRSEALLTPCRRLFDSDTLISGNFQRFCAKTRSSTTTVSLFFALVDVIHYSQLHVLCKRRRWWHGTDSGATAHKTRWKICNQPKATNHRCPKPSSGNTGSTLHGWLCGGRGHPGTLPAATQ